MKQTIPFLLTLLFGLASCITNVNNNGMLPEKTAAGYGLAYQRNVPDAAVATPIVVTPMPTPPPLVVNLTVSRDDLLSTEQSDRSITETLENPTVIHDLSECPDACATPTPCTAFDMEAVSAYLDANGYAGTYYFCHALTSHITADIIFGKEGMIRAAIVTAGNRQAATVFQRGNVPVLRMTPGMMQSDITGDTAIVLPWLRCEMGDVPQ